MEMKIKKLSFMEVALLSVCIILIFLVRTNYVLSFIFSLLILFGFENHLINDKVEIKKEKKFLYAFILVFFVYMAIQIFSNFVNTDHYTLNQWRLFFQVPLTMTILLGYLFKVRLNDFNWGITLKSFLVIIIIFISLELGTIVDLRMESNTMSFYIKNFIQKLFYPSIIEEVLFRGFFINGLLAFDEREDKANIIQSIIFGIVHIISYNELSIIILLSTCIQVFIGYIFGKIYLQTKSLTPCILLHTLINTI